jgi:hypothetical protein
MQMHVNLVAATLLSAVAGCGQVTFGTASINSERSMVVVNSTTERAKFLAALTELKDQSRWKVFYKGTGVKIESVEVDERTRVVRLAYDPDSSLLPPTSQLKTGDLVVEYHPAGADPLTISSITKIFPIGGFRFTSSKKTADVDISGGVQAGVAAKPQYFWNVKAGYPFYLPNGRGQISPTFEGKASQQRNADPDSLKASIKYDRRWPITGRKGLALDADLLGYEFERAIKNEYVVVDGEAKKRQFLEKNTNIVWSGTASWVSAWPVVNFNIAFAGIETGKAVTRTIKKDSRNHEVQGIARQRFKLDLFRNGMVGGRKVTFDGHYSVRLPLIAEPFQRAGVNGDQPFLTKKPRHNVDANLGFLVNNGLGITVQYKYGSLPPSFEFVDHQVTIGFNLLLKRK